MIFVDLFLGLSLELMCIGLWVNTREWVRLTMANEGKGAVMQEA
ncbi:MAG: hypothetical protein ACWA5X_11405 [bacterium]